MELRNIVHDSIGHTQVVAALDYAHVQTIFNIYLFVAVLCNDSYSSSRRHRIVHPNLYYLTRDNHL